MVKLPFLKQLEEEEEFIEEDCIVTEEFSSSCNNIQAEQKLIYQYNSHLFDLVSSK